MLIILIGVASAAFVYFLISWVTSRNAYRKSTQIQRTNAVIEESRKLEARQSLQARLSSLAAAHGWQGSLSPLAAGFSFLYAAAILAFLALGLSSVLAFIGAIPVCIASVWIVIRTMAERRKARFRRQLLQALNLMAAQIESGSGPQRAMEQIVSQLEDPLGEELARVLAQAGASKDLIGALKDLEVRYPTRAMSMLTAALEIDRKNGGQLAPVLRQAAAVLEREFELTAEARAEVSQARSEFFIITAIILGICFFMISSTSSNGAFTNFAGIVILFIFGGNFVWGIYRVMRTLGKARGQS